MRYFLTLMGIFALFTYSPMTSQEIWIHQRINDKIKIDKYEASTVDSITFRPCDSSKTGCCQFALRLLNKVENKFKTIRVTPANPAEIKDVFMDDELDGDDWTLTAALGGVRYDFSYINGFIPANPELMDVEFTIQVNSSISSPKINVEWIDINGVTQKTEQITLQCISDPKLGEDDFTYDWSINTIKLSGELPDEQVFAGAEAEPCESKLDYVGKTASCGFIVTDKPFCLNSKYYIKYCVKEIIQNGQQNEQPNIVIGTIKYNWTLNGIPINNNSSCLTYELATGNGNTPFNIQCTQTGTYKEQIPDPNDTTGTKYIDKFTTDYEICNAGDVFHFCFPTAEFINSAPEPICDVNKKLTGYSVKLTPFTECTSKWFEWEFDDGSNNLNGGGTVGEITHIFTKAGQYSVSLNVMDELNCKQYTYHKTIVISDECKPDFEGFYDFCDDGKLDPKRKYPVTMTFTNLSNSFCNTEFEWDFGDGTTKLISNNKGNVNHTYMTFPNQNFTVTLKMTDKDNCSTPVTISHQFSLKPVKNDMKLVVCGDGIVKYSNTANAKGWKIPNWQALVHDPAYYCFPVPTLLGAPVNILLNSILALGKTSIPQLLVNRSFLGIKNFEIRFKPNAVITSTCEVFDYSQSFVTGRCTKDTTVVNTISCCKDFNARDSEIKTIGSKKYKMKKKLRIHYRERHGDQGIGSCFDFYASYFWDEKTLLKAKTILKVEKKVKIGPLTIAYYQRTKATRIDAGIDGVFKSKDPSTGCNCGLDENWKDGNDENNRKSVVYRTKTPTLYKINSNNPLKSYHQVVKNGVTWDSYIVKPIGMCSP
jgi:hypothetical protein